ncbi:MAG: GrpB family protein [Thermoproteota archaeon]
MPGPIVIVDYNSQWPLLYEEEKKNILAVIGHKALAIEHIGSTAVPGLGAKPIIDIMVCVNNAPDAEECVPLLRRIGYNDVTPEEGNPDWYYCLGKGIHSVGYHLHLMRYGSNFAKKHLIFRDYLRAHPDVAQQYYEIKKIMAAKHRFNRVAYTESKTSFIESVVTKACRT